MLLKSDTLRLVSVDVQKWAPIAKKWKVIKRIDPNMTDPQAAYSQLLQTSEILISNTNHTCHVIVRDKELG